ncbi:hypothetical protein MYRNA_51 [Mycobacterium phage Myrna]|uniref:Uncharacterized protein n=1 Tax=Mycobacterium phage Myrna TaxID=546805 RepID=B5LJ62_9CAUD|nr:gp51 [Mycobacterium phage Myrna]ACH62059.1 hypothetical protein MYRNA_51 [Mycobacterium phage Myrna]
MTRTYARETVTFTQAQIDALVAEGRATYYPGLPGYVIDRKQAVRMHQIVAAPVVDTVWSSPIEDDNAAEAWLADQDRYEVPAASWDTIEAADAMGISVGEYTDGEYRDPRPASGRSAVFRKFDDILSDFGI